MHLTSMTPLQLLNLTIDFSSLFFGLRVLALIGLKSNMQNNYVTTYEFYYRDDQIIGRRKMSLEELWKEYNYSVYNRSTSIRIYM